MQTMNSMPPSAASMTAAPPGAGMKNAAGVGACLGDGVLDGGEDGHAVDVGAGLLGARAGDDLRAVVTVSRP